MGDSKAIYVSMGEGFLNELFFFSMNIPVSPSCVRFLRVRPKTCVRLVLG